VPPRTDSTEIPFADRKVRCGLVHDHVLLREGLRRLLEDEPDIEVVSEAGNAAECLRKVHELRPDVVVADSATFELPASEAERLIAQESPGTKVVFLSEEEQPGFSPDSARSEQTCAVRQTSAGELAEMVRHASSGGPALSAEASPRLNLQRPATSRFREERSLTAREREVLKLLAEGKTVRGAATILGLSLKTVDAHKFNLMRKLGIHNKAELVMWAIQRKVVKLPVNF